MSNSLRERALNMWNERYNTPGYLFGTEPAAFLSREANRIAAGQTALCVADGEGRNSVFLATRGLAVTAMDASDVAVAKSKCHSMIWRKLMRVLAFL